MRHYRPSYRLRIAAAMFIAMGGAMHAQEALPILTRELQVQSTNTGSPLIKISAPNALGSTYSMILPPGAGEVGDVLTWSASTGALIWQAPNTSSWSLTGNATTNAWNGTAGTRLGTTSAYPLVLATTNAAAQDIRFFTGINGATERLRITGDDGYVGIGTTSPSTLLDVAGTFSAAGEVTLASLDGTAATSIPVGYNRIVIANGAGKLEEASISTVVGAGIAGNAWALSGNAGTTAGGTLGTSPTGNFVGTTGTGANARDLSFVTNNVIQAQIGTDSVLRTYRDIIVNGITVGSAMPIGGVPTNAALGFEALKLNATSTANVAIGNKAMRNLTSGLDNVAVGANALFTTAYSADNTAIGSGALYKLNVQFNTAPFGDKNVALGSNALYNLPSGVGNVAIGSTALGNENIGGSYNTAVGVEAGASHSTGGLVENSANSVFIGAFAGPKATAQTNQIAIGYLTYGNGSNTVTIGNESIVATHLRGHLNLTYPANTSTAPELRLYEPSLNGANYTAFKAGVQSADITYTLPTTGGSSGQALTTDGSGTLSWGTVAQVSVAGTTDRVAKFTSASTIGNSRISDGSTALTIGTENISSIEIGTAQTTGTITIGGTSGTGMISIGNGTSTSRADIEIGRNGHKWIQVGSESNADNRVILVGRGEAAVTAYGTFSVRPTQSDNSLVAPALRLMERHQGVGTPNYVALKSPNDLTANYTLEFPANDGDANQVLTTDGSGVLSWTTPLTSATGWSLTGNTGTNATTNFLGTTDNQDVVFKRFNIEAFRITTDSLSFSTSRDVFINGVRAGRGGSGGFTGFVSNTVFGSDAMTSVFGGATAEKNSAFGRRALYAVTMGGDNTAVGFGALEFTTTGSHNTALGSGAIGLSTTGSQNVAVGWRAMYTTGASDISSSTAVGYEAGRYINGANGLTAVGYGALSGATTTSVTGTNNTALGLQAGASVTTGSNNLFLGAASSIGTGSDNNSIVIGYNATGIGSNTVVLGNSSIVTTALRGNVLINNSGASAGQVRFLEGSAGMDYAAIQAPASLAAPYTLTLPANDGDANQVLTTDGSGTLSWTTPSTSVPLSSITAATADNTINSGNNEQEWQWNSLGQNRQGLTLSSNSTTVGGSSWRVLRVRANGSANTPATIAALEVENSTTDGGVAPVNAGAYIWASNGNVNIGAQGAGIAAIATTSNTGLLGTATSSANVTTNYGVRGTVDVTAGTNTTAYAGYFTSAPSGTGAITTNVAGYFSATGGANNYAIIVPASSGTVGIGTTAPAVSMDINGGLAVQPGAQVDITADNQLVTIVNRSSVIVSSNNSPANRTITLSNGLQTGQILYIMVTGTAAGNGVEIVDDPVGANTNLTGLAQLLDGAVMQLIWDGADWREVSRSNN